MTEIDEAFDGGFRQTAVMGPTDGIAYRMSEARDVMAIDRDDQIVIDAEIRDVTGMQDPLASLVGQTVVAANDLVSAWARLYAAISGHTLPFVGTLFDKCARENVQRERIATLARDFLSNLPRELEQVEALLTTAADLAHDRDMMVNQPWSISYIHDAAPGHDVTDMRHPEVPQDVILERVTQFEDLLRNQKQLYQDIMDLVVAFSLSRDIEKARVLNRSSVIAAEMKFSRKLARPRSGPRHKDWRPSLIA